MSIKSKLLYIAGKDSFTLDNRISNSYILYLCWKYGQMLLYGKLKAFRHSSIANDIFIGSKVKLYEKRHLSIGSKTKIHDYVKIDALSKDGVQIGSNCVIGRGTIIECTGSLEHLGKGIKIGNRTTFGNDCFLGAAGGIEIGNDVIAGQYIRFHSENHNYKDINKLIKEQGVTHKGIKIGNNCWIGSGSVFLDGAVLGDGCVVAANAVVTKKFLNNSVIAGVPAKLLKIRGEN